MARVEPKLALRPFLPADAPLLAEIFRASVAELTGDDYGASQQEAWASMADDEAAFATRLANALTLLGTIDGSPVGFLETFPLARGVTCIDERVHPICIDDTAMRVIFERFAFCELEHSKKTSRRLQFVLELQLMQS